MTKVSNKFKTSGKSSVSTRTDRESFELVEKLSLSTFRKLFGYTEIVKVVRENANGYPFITFLTDKNVAENIYFSIKASDKVAAGIEVDAKFFSRNEFLFAEVKNQQGENRWKIIGKGDSNRLSLDEFED